MSEEEDLEKERKLLIDEIILLLKYRQKTPTERILRVLQSELILRVLQFTFLILAIVYLIYSFLKG